VDCVPRYRIGVDTGGTFTDLVVIDDETGARRTIKVPSTPGQPARAVFEALRRSGVPPAEIGFFVLGTTIATNCLLERKGQRVVFLTTQGFEDVPFIQRINRKSLFDLQWRKPDPYVARRDCIGVRERIAYDGSIRISLEQDEIERVVLELSRKADEASGDISVAISLLFSYVDPEHEQRLAAAVREGLPAVPVSVSSDVVPIWREYERANTVIVNGYLGRLVGEFSRELDEGLEAHGVGVPGFLLKSNGGQIPARAAASTAVNLILSGLAGGLIAGSHFAEQLGRSDVITLDMGGTSCDVGVVTQGQIRSTSQYEFEWGLPIAVPVVDLTTIGAGGSSIAGFDQGGLLRVGPESAGADPGPASYGLGGADATVTDANLVLGRLDPAYFLGGEMPLDADRARAAVAPVAARLGLTLEEGAQAVVEVATENMASAIRLLATNRGLDYRHFELMAFGGAGPLHAALLSRRVGLAGVIVPPNPGLTSAFGTLAADLRVDRRITRVSRSDRTVDGDLRSRLEQIAREALDELRLEGELSDPAVVLTVSCRYLGQNYEQDIGVTLETDDLVRSVVRRFHEAHERAYGYRIPDAIVEFVYLSAVAVEHRPPPASLDLASLADPTPASSRPVYFKDDGWVGCPIYRRADLGRDVALPGPLVVEEIDSTTLVLEGQVVRTHPTGSLLITESRGGGPTTLVGTTTHSGRIDG
jgi:N-methylhydantoinase A